MNLLRLYLQFFNSPAAWTVYAARNQNLSLPSPAVETHYNPPQQDSVHARRQGHFPKIFVVK
jgi:hypothetical protein